MLTRSFSRLLLRPVTTRVCKDLAAHDHPGCNPFRELLPLAAADASHAFLLHILVATSAIHLYNITSPDPSVGPLLGSSSADGQQQRRRGKARAIRPNEAVSRRAFVDALAAKVTAIRELRVALGRMDAVGSDVVLAAVLFFVNFELILPGTTAWKMHLDGALKIMAPLKFDDELSVGTSRSQLRDCVVTDCLM